MALYEFGSFVLDASGRQLTRQGERLSVTGKTLGSDCIETVARNGYRLTLPVRAVNRQALSESREIQREARYQLGQAERVPALRALGLFERALALDPDDAGALAGLASTYLLLASTTIRRPLPVNEAKQVASDTARRARAVHRPVPAFPAARRRAALRTVARQARLHQLMRTPRLKAWLSVPEPMSP